MGTYYKPILWVDDEIPPKINTYPIEIDWEEVGRIFGKYKNDVRPYNGVLEALQYIRDNFGQFDVAVLDINLTGGIKDDKEWDDISELLTNAKIIPRKLEELGFSIFQYLLMLGFPIDRIIFRTAYANTYTEYYDIFNKAGFSIPIDFFDKASGDLRKISELYENDNSYFKVREIVFEAVEYWLAKKENQKNYEKLKISKSESDRILHDVMLHLPLRPAESLKKGDKNYREYHAVLAVLAAPFEADIDLSDPYQQVMKLLRNWTAHGKFSNPDDLSERIFLLLFLTAMRAYFSPYEDNENCFEYEKEAFYFLRNNGENRTDEEWKKHIYSFYSFIGGAYIFNRKLYDTLDTLGKNKNKKDMRYGYLLEILLSYGFGVSLKYMKRETIKITDKFPGIPIYLNFNQANNEFLKGIIKCFPLDAKET